MFETVVAIAGAAAPLETVLLVGGQDLDRKWDYVVIHIVLGDGVESERWEVGNSEVESPINWLLVLSSSLNGN